MNDEERKMDNQTPGEAIPLEPASGGLTAAELSEEDLEKAAGGQQKSDGTKPRISSISSGGDRPTESLSLNFTKIEF